MGRRGGAWLCKSVGEAVGRCRGVDKRAVGVAKEQQVEPKGGWSWFVGVV